MAEELMFKPGAGERDEQDMEMGEGVEGMEEEDRTEEYRASLDQMVAKIEDKYREANAMGFMADNEHGVEAEDTMRAIFQIMAGMGVDLNDENQIREFMEKLQEENPDMYELFESTMNQILNNDTSDEGIFGAAKEEAPMMPEGGDIENIEQQSQSPMEQFPGMAEMQQ